MNLHNELRPTVVVTGASEGIGRAIANVAAREGGPVVPIARSGEGLADAAAEVRRSGGEPFVFTLDLAAPSAPAEVETFLASHNLACEVLVNNAGYGLLGAAVALSREDQLGILDLNIRALSDLTLRFLPRMVARRSGGIINLSSIAGFLPGPYMALYFASKAFVRSFSEALWEEMHGTGVTITCVAPGPVRTRFLAKAGARRVPLFKLLPKVTGEMVAERAWRGFKRGRRMVVPGMVARFTAYSAALLPRALALSLVARLQGHRSG